MQQQQQQLEQQEKQEDSKLMAAFGLLLVFALLWQHLCKLVLIVYTAHCPRPPPALSWING